jgi:hypothetical protein
MESEMPYFARMFFDKFEGNKIVRKIFGLRDTVDPMEIPMIHFELGGK